MATIKAYTDLQQSKKLAEILPLKSADMCCFQNQNGDINYYGFPFLQGNKTCNPIPCWSLAALISVLPKIDNYRLEIRRIESGYCCCYTEENNGGDLYWYYADNPINACVAMVEKLNELNLL